MLKEWRQRLARHVAEAELLPPFGPMARWVYACIAGYVVIAAPLFLWRGFTVNGEVWLTVGLWPLLVAGGLMLRRLGAQRGATALESIGLIHAQGFMSIWFFFAIARYSGPWADGTLAGWDRALGFSWVDFLHLAQPYLSTLRAAYHTFGWQPTLILLTLAWLSRHRTAWIFVTAASLSLVITLCLFIVFPAKAAMVHFGVGQELEGTSFLQPLEYLRDGGTHISLDLFNGFITFPSYHAASGTLFIWASWQTILRWPLLILNTLLIVGAIPIGAHYLVDILAGITLAVASIWLAKRLVPGDERQMAPA